MPPISGNLIYCPFGNITVKSLTKQIAVQRQPNAENGRISNEVLVVEKFKPGKAEQVYERFYEKGRMLPSGLRYVDSWLSSDRTQCFQLMETDKMELFDEWIANWNDLTDFEVVLVEDSPTKTAQQKMD